MSLRLLHRFGFALWLGLIALTASTLAQNQLSNNVLVAAFDTGSGHTMPDGTFMAGSMGHADHQAPAQDGHTHKGHSDCAMCGVVASMAALAVPVLDAVLVPDVFAKPSSPALARSFIADRVYAPYSSRAPPQLIG